MSKNSENDGISRDWDPAVPFDLPSLPPSPVVETSAVLKACIEARALLAELKRAAEALPDQRVLLATLPVLEAKASSEIENIVTTHDAMFRHLDRASAKDPATKEALRYREALLVGFQGLRKRPLGTVLAEQIATRILGVETQVRRVPGTTLQSGTGEVIYTPPAGEEHLRRLLANWERFLHEQDGLDPLVRLAIGHYQFEAIHPFPDGNGRTGRVLNSLYLVEQNLLTLPILYASRSIIRRHAEYYRGLRAVTRDGAWEPWILFMLEVVEESAGWTLHRVLAMRALWQETADAVREELPKLFSHELVRLLFEQPYCRIEHLVAAGLAQRETASKYLRALADAGFVEEQRSGREVMFVNRRLMEVLEAS